MLRALPPLTRGNKLGALDTRAVYGLRAASRVLTQHREKIKFRISKNNLLTINANMRPQIEREQLLNCKLRPHPNHACVERVRTRASTRFPRMYPPPATRHSCRPPAQQATPPTPIHLQLLQRLYIRMGCGHRLAFVV